MLATIAMLQGKSTAIFGRARFLRTGIERFNLTLRMCLRRFTRLTNGHSKSMRQHKAMQSLSVSWYNFGRKHEALKGKTSAMASGMSDHVWTIKEATLT